MNETDTRRVLETLCNREGGEMSEITYHVPAVHCQACEASIRRALGKLAGIGRVDVDLDQKRVTVQFEEDRTNLKEIKDRLERAGFDVA